MTLESAIEYAEDYLPKGWSLKVTIETGYATVELFDDADEFFAAYDFDREVPTGARILELVESARVKVGEISTK